LVALSDIFSGYIDPDDGRPVPGAPSVEEAPAASKTDDKDEKDEEKRMTATTTRREATADDPGSRSPALYRQSRPVGKTKKALEKMHWFAAASKATTRLEELALLFIRPSS